MGNYHEVYLAMAESADNLIDEARKHHSDMINFVLRTHDYDGLNARLYRESRDFKLQLAENKARWADLMLRAEAATDAAADRSQVAAEESRTKPRIWGFRSWLVR